MDTNIIIDMGALAEIAYSDYGQGNFIDYGEVIVANENQTLYLTNSYTVVDYIDTNTSMQAILLEKNDSAGDPTGQYVISFRGTQE
jgi:hypothetical protein